MTVESDGSYDWVGELVNYVESSKVAAQNEGSALAEIVAKKDAAVAQAEAPFAPGISEIQASIRRITDSIEPAKLEKDLRAKINSDNTPEVYRAALDIALHRNGWTFSKFVEDARKHVGGSTSLPSRASALGPKLVSVTDFDQRLSRAQQSEPLLELRLYPAITDVDDITRREYITWGIEAAIGAVVAGTGLRVEYVEIPVEDTVSNVSRPEAIHVDIVGAEEIRTATNGFDSAVWLDDPRVRTIGDKAVTLMSRETKPSIFQQRDVDLEADLDAQLQVRDAGSAMRIVKYGLVAVNETIRKLEGLNLADKPAIEALKKASQIVISQLDK